QEGHVDIRPVGTTLETARGYQCVTVDRLDYAALSTYSELADSRRVEVTATSCTVVSGRQVCTTLEVRGRDVPSTLSVPNAAMEVFAGCGVHRAWHDRAHATTLGFIALVTYTDITIVQHPAYGSQLPLIVEMKCPKGLTSDSAAWRL